MKKILVVVDMQNDFIDGPLGTPEARVIVDNVCAKIREGEWDLIVTTQDSHFENYLKTQEGKKLPVEHCVMGTPGWYLNHKIHEQISETRLMTKNVTKYTFGSWDLPSYINHVKYEDYSAVECTLVGVCTDICVISNALLLKAHYPEMKIVVDAACCAGSSPEKHRMALEVMKSCQVEIVNYIPDCGR